MRMQLQKPLKNYFLTPIRHPTELNSLSVASVLLGFQGGLEGQHSTTLYHYNIHLGLEVAP